VQEGRQRSGRRAAPVARRVERAPGPSSSPGANTPVSTRPSIGGSASLPVLSALGFLATTSRWVATRSSTRRRRSARV